MTEVTETGRTARNP